MDMGVRERLISERGGSSGRYATLTIRRIGGPFSITAAQCERVYDAAADSKAERFTIEESDVTIIGDGELFAFDQAAPILSPSKAIS